MVASSRQFPDSRDSLTNDQHASSREIEREIARTRHEMDETLNKIGDRLHPKHLLDEVVDLFRSDEGKAKRHEYTQQARGVGKQIARSIKDHPVPAMFCGLGLAWLLYEEFLQEEEAPGNWRDLREHSGSFVDARTGEPYDDSYGEEWKGVATWDQQFDWSKAGMTRESWNDRANRSLGEMRDILSNNQLSSRDRMRLAAGKVLSLSGRKRRDIHDQWANLREHSGSFVDARTGEPYDENYGRDLQHLLACDFAASHDWSEEEEATWSEKAQHALEELQSMLSDTSSTVQDKLRGAAAAIGGFVGSTRDFAADYGSRARQYGSRMQEQARRGASRMKHQMGAGYSRSREGLSAAIEESPLAAAAAFIGLGLLAGLVLPSTRSEDRLMGEAADDVKDRARDAGQEVMERGQRVAEATMTAASEELERQELAPDQIREKAQRVVSSAQEAIQQETGSVDELKQKAAAVAERAKEAAQEETQRQKDEATSA